MGWLGLRAAPQQQKPGAIARLIIDGIGQFSDPLLLSRLARCHGSTEARAPHQAGGFSGGTGGKLQGLGQVLLQPTAALRQSLGMGKHLGDLLEAAVSQQGMANRQDQGMLDDQSTMALLAGLPQQIRTARHSAFN